MNNTTQQLATHFSISLDEAFKVQKVLECCVGIDYSEASPKATQSLFDEARELFVANDYCGCGI